MWRVLIAKLVLCVVLVAGSPSPSGAVSLGIDYVFGPTKPGKWGSPARGTGARVSWSLMPAGVKGRGLGTITPLSAFMPPGFEAEIESAFAAWSSAANIQFFQVHDNGRPFGHKRASGQIRIGGVSIDGPGRQLGFAYFPPKLRGSRAGDIFLDRSENWTIDTSGVNIYLILLHEIGHSIGLGHPPAAEVLMSATIARSIRGLTPAEIAGAQALYGPPVAGGATLAAPSPAVRAGHGLAAAAATLAPLVALATDLGGPPESMQSPAPVPLPPALALLCAATLALALVGRRGRAGRA
jgi:hypothetical protein